ncbi:MAG: polysaccharide deacetylase family protein [Candidatus Dormibacteria bacterium]
MAQGPRVTLTFDNGPVAPVTGRVLDILGERSVRSTFFVVGDQLRRPGAVELARRAAAEGHWIGNHTLTHTVPLGELDDAADVAREIDETEALIGSLAHPDRLFRPFGSGGMIDGRLLGAHALRHLKEGGFTCILWNCVPHDWDDPTGWVETCLKEVVTRAWSVVVVHDVPTGAMDRLPDLLDALEAMDADLVQEFPDQCVPLRRGVPTVALQQLSPLGSRHPQKDG